MKNARHSFITQLYEIIETERCLLLVMEYLPNGELFNRILKEKR